MKILCVIDSLGSGGAQRQLVGLALGFKARGHYVSFLVYHEISFFKNQLDDAQIPLNYIIEPNYLKRLLKIRSFIRKGSYDAVLSFLQASGFISEIAGLPYRKWKLVVGERSANPNMFRSPKLILYRWFHLLADYVVANSQLNINMVRKINPLLRQSKCRVIYNMVDLDYWKPYTGKYMFHKEGRVNLVVIASHSYIKNLNGLVEAVNMLSLVQKNVLKIQWYGAVSLDDSKMMALERIRNYGLEEVFEFYEPVQDVRSVIYQADAVGLFSFYEGLPNVICEAMACCKPVVLSDVSDILLLMNDDENGFFCYPHNPESIKEALIGLMDASTEKLQIMGKKNRKLAEQLFNSGKIIDSYMDIISLNLNK